MTYLIKPRKGRRKSGKKEIKSKFNNQKTITNVVDINPIISIIAFDINGLRKPIKRKELSEYIKKSSQDPTINIYCL